jgi:hypothetical protein
MSSTPQNRGSEATSMTPLVPAEATRVSVHSAVQRPTRTPSGTPLSSFRTVRELELADGTFRPRPCASLPRERYRPLQEPGMPSTTRKPFAGSNPHRAVLVTHHKGSDGKNTLFFAGQRRTL